MNDTAPLVNAYRQFIRDFASLLANDAAMNASMIDQDVNDIYNFEKDISVVNKTLFYFLVDE